MSAHTPGPWEATNMERDDCFPSVFIGPELPYPDGSGTFRARIVINQGPTPEDVAKGTGFGTTMETCRANARLIAASLDMLALLKAYVAEDPCAPNDPRFIEAQRLIAKATEVQP